MPQPLLVIGYGNTLRGDDGVGVRVTEALRALPEAGDVPILTAMQLTPELADAVRHASRVIFIDAAVDLPAGVWRKTEVHAAQTPAADTSEESSPAPVGRPGVLPGTGGGGGSGGVTHHFSPQRLLELALVAFGVAPRGVLLSIGGGNFELGEELSAPVAGVVGEVTAEIVRMIQTHRQGGGGDA